MSAQHLAVTSYTVGCLLSIVWFTVEDPSLTQWEEEAGHLALQEYALLVCICIHNKFLGIHAHIVLNLASEGKVLILY